MLGVVAELKEGARVRYLEEPVPVTDELRALTQPVDPRRVLRVAAPCAGAACHHFEAGVCRLAERVVGQLPEASTKPPPCRLRPRCRWWRQEGIAACRRCPQLITQLTVPSELMRSVADDPGAQGATPS